MYDKIHYKKKINKSWTTKKKEGSDIYEYIELIHFII